MATQSAAPESRTFEQRKFRGVNLTDARVAIDNDEFAWLENFLSVGNGAIQGVRGPGPAVATLAAGMYSIWGFTLHNSPVIIIVGQDGSLTEVAGLPGGYLGLINNLGNPLQLLNNAGHPLTIFAGITTPIAPAGTVTTAAHLTIWRDGPVLIIDPTKGYSRYDGGGAGGYAVIDPAKLGTSIAVFEGRVWIGRNRTILISAPNDYTDFNAAHGATSFVLTDEAFPGAIVAMLSVIGQLWVLGEGAVDTISNVQTTTLGTLAITTFSVTNIVTGIGTVASQSAIGYIRSLTFLSPSGLYGLAGVTPEKLSSKINGLFPSLDLSPTITAAIAFIESLPVLCLLVTYRDPAKGPRPLVIGFTEGKLFFASQGSLRWLTTLIANGVSQAWGTDGTRLYQLFGGAADQPVPYRIVSKLYDLGSATTAKKALKVGFEFQAQFPISASVTLDSDTARVPVNLGAANTGLVIVNDLNEPLQLLNDIGNPLTLWTGGMILAKGNADNFGHYLGFTVEGTDPPYRGQAFELQYQMTREWSHP